MSESGKDDGMMAQRLGRITQDNDNPHPVGSAAWYEWVNDFSDGYHKAAKSKRPMTDTLSKLEIPAFLKKSPAFASGSSVKDSKKCVFLDIGEDGTPALSNQGIQHLSRQNRDPIRKPVVNTIPFEEFKKVMCVSHEQFDAITGRRLGGKSVVQARISAELQNSKSEKSEFDVFKALAEVMAIPSSLLKTKGSHIDDADDSEFNVFKVVPDGGFRQNEFLTVGSSVGTRRISSRTSIDEGRPVIEDSRPIITKKGIVKQEEVGIEYDAMKLIAISRGANGEVSFQPVYTLRGAEVFRLPPVKFINGCTITFGGIKGRVEPKQ